MTNVTTVNTTDIVGTMQARNKAYDVIAIWHGIEHLPDPWAVLRQCAQQLAPHGVLVIATPNPDSIQFGIFRQYWVHLDAPRHVS
jgi:2-polyprenyl-3-methyl-5-hydroxy-6-metoxy-1,4-benzoquinol methylase